MKWDENAMQFIRFSIEIQTNKLVTKHHLGVGRKMITYIGYEDSKMF